MSKSAKLNSEEKSQLTVLLTQILESWQLSDTEQLELLQLSDLLKARQLHTYRSGEASFDFDDKLINRSKMIIGINASLATTFPTNTKYGAIWLRRNVKKFKHKTPLNLMLSGDIGMRRVWGFLDCTQNWAS